MKQKAEVNYSLGHKHSHCGRVSKDDKGSCRFFIPGKGYAYSGEGTCEKVAGQIRRPYWCELFEKAE